MLALTLLFPAAAMAAAVASASKDQCDPNLVSCSAAALKANPCCVPHAGLLVFRQRFEPDNGDNGQWGIAGVDVLECDGSRPKATKQTNAKLTHEEIGSRCARAGFNEDEAERAWAQSEVGEGVEEVWERSWNTDGRYISSICDGDVSRFFRALGELHVSLPTTDWLADADITTSADVTYYLADIKKALSQQGHEPTLHCEDATLVEVHYPLNVVGNMGKFVPHRKSVGKDTCPVEGIIYPPSAILPSPTPASWDPVRDRPTMRPITLSHDESRQVKYPEDEEEDTGAKKKEKKKLGFFSGKDKGRTKGKFGHDEFAGRRDEL